MRRKALICWTAGVDVWIYTVVSLWRSETSDLPLPRHRFRLLLAYSHHNEQRKKLREPSFNWESPSRQVTTAFDHHQSWVRRGLQGSHCSDLPGGKQGRQFDSSLAFSKLIRYWVYIWTPIGASVFFLLRAPSVAWPHIQLVFLFLCSVVCL